MRTFVLLCLFLTACGPGGDPQESTLMRGPKYGAQPSKKVAPDVPASPAPDLTPGDLCDQPDEYRYPEQIPYCRRDVSRDTKDKVFSLYEATFQFSVKSLGRENFKVDHHIPLCLGGSNKIENLWPQYQTSYKLTDPIEFRLCQLLEQGDLTQDMAVDMIQDVKAHLQKAEEMRKALENGTYRG